MIGSAVGGYEKRRLQTDIQWFNQDVHSFVAVAAGNCRSDIPACGIPGVQIVNHFAGL